MGKSSVVVFAFAVAVLAVIVLLLKLIDFFLRFGRESRYLTEQASRAADMNEYRRWQRALRCHYLCLVPFVSSRNVDRLYTRLFCRPKHSKKDVRSDGAWHLLMPSIVGFCLCAVCLCGVSFAWFSSSQSSGVNMIRSASYAVEADIVEADTLAKVPFTETELGGFTVSLPVGTYRVTLKSDSVHATAKNGYCQMNCGDRIFYTEPIGSGASLVFTVTITEPTELTLVPQIGSCAYTENSIADGTRITLP